MFLAGLDGNIPNNGLCANGSGVCSKEGICVWKDGTFAIADLSILLRDTADLAINTLVTYW